MKIAAIYARVSTARQEEEHTIKTQLSAVSELVEKNGLTVVAEYIDEGWSGDVLARPALDRLRQDAKTKKWQTVVIYDPDRLARRYSYQELVMDELKEANIEVLFVTVSTPQNSEEKILHGVRGLFAEYERAKINERFRLGKLRKVREGHLLVSEAAYGYRYISMKDRVHGYYEIHPEEAKIVKMIFEWVDQDHLTLWGLVRKLNELNIKPRKSRREVWSTSTLSRLLRNRTYIGEARWGSTVAVVPQRPVRVEKYRKNRKSSRRMKPQSEWITIPVPGIIKKELFDSVQERLRLNFKFTQRNTKNEYLLAGIIHCACGRRRGGEGPQNGKHLYYRCVDRALSRPLPPTCQEKSIRARDADGLVWKNISRLMSSPALLNEQIEWFKHSRTEKSERADIDINAAQREISKLKKQLARYNEAYASGLFTLEQLSEFTIKLRDQIAGYELQLERAKDKGRELDSCELPEDIDVASFALESAKKLTDLNFSAKREIVRAVVQKVVGTRERLIVTGAIPIPDVNVLPDDNKSEIPDLSSNRAISHINVLPIHRFRQRTPRHRFCQAVPHIIPFRFEIDIPLIVSDIQNN